MARPNLKLIHTGIILVAVPLIFELMFVGILAFQLWRADAEIERQIRTKDILAQANTVNSLYTDVQMALSNYVISGGVVYADMYKKKTEELALALSQLRSLPANSDFQKGTVDVLEYNVRKGLTMLEEGKTEFESADRSSYISRQLFRAFRSMPTIDTQLNILRSDEQGGAAAGIEKQRELRTGLGIVLFMAVLLSILLSMVLAHLFSRRIANRVNVMRDNSLKLSIGGALSPPVGGTDEIGELDETFHQMARSLSEARRKERALVENAVDVICSIDDRGVFTEVSAACLSTLGFKPEDLLGQRYISLVPENDRPRMIEAVERSIRESTPLTIETAVKHKDGTSVDVLWSGSWASEDKSLFCVLHDITERKKMERLKKEFVQMISHDLRTPLTALQMTLTLLTEGVYGSLNPQGQKRIEYAASDASRLINLINQLLEFERMESGKVDLFIEEADISDLVAQSVEAMMSLAEQRGIKLETVAHKTTIRADSNKIVQVIVNLIGNAIKFSPSGSAITVAAEVVGDVMEVKVIDQGRGISEEFRDKIFDRFQQVEVNDARVQGGSGLGLAICKTIVTEHGGTIGVDSEEGIGSTFWFRIPLNAAPTVNVA